MNAFETNFKVGTKVKVYNPYGSFTFESTVESISPKGKYIKVRGQNYTAVNENYATYISRWGQGSITVIQNKGEINNENIFIKSHFLCRQ